MGKGRKEVHTNDELYRVHACVVFFSFCVFVPVSPSLSLCVFLSLSSFYLSVSLSVSLSSFCLYLSMSLFLSLLLSFSLHRSLCLSLCVSLCLCLSLCLISLKPSLSLYACLSLCVSLSLSARSESRTYWAQREKERGEGQAKVAGM